MTDFRPASSLFQSTPPVPAAAPPFAPASAVPVGPDITVPAGDVFPILRENILVDGFHLVIDLEASHGCTIVDALERREYLDCYSYFATQPLGHNHPGLDDPAFQATLLRAALANPANSDMYTREYAAFVATFRRL